MEFSVLQENLAPALVASKAFTGSGTLPVLRYVLLTAEKGGIRLEATDLERRMTTWVGAVVTEEGSICLPYSVLADFIGNLRAGRIDFKVEDGARAMITAGNDSGDMEGLPADDFPPCRELMPHCVATFDAREMLKLVRRVAPFAATEESRPILTGVSLKLGLEGYVAAAADGFRLSKQAGLLASWVPPEGKEDEEIQFTIPARTLLEVGKALRGSDKPVKVDFDLSALMARFNFEGKTGEIQVASSLLVGTFPNYEQLIPTQHIWAGSMVVSDFKRVARAASTFAKDSSNILRLNFRNDEQGKTKLVISAAADGVGQSWDPVDVIDPFGMDTDPMPYIAFNGRWLLELIGVCEDLVQIGGSTSSSPGVFQMEHEEFTHVMMPMFVQWGNEPPRPSAKPAQEEPVEETPEPAQEPEPEPEPEAEVPEEEPVVELSDDESDEAAAYGPDPDEVEYLPAESEAESEEEFAEVSDG